MYSDNQVWCLIQSTQTKVVILLGFSSVGVGALCPSKITATSSVLSPLVSGTNITMKAVPNPHKTLNPMNVGPIPRTLIMQANWLVIRKAKNQFRDAEMELATPRVFGEKISLMIIQGIGPKPIEKNTMKRATLVRGMKE